MQLKALIECWLLVSLGTAMLVLLPLHIAAAFQTKRWLSVKGQSFEVKTSLRTNSIYPEGLLAIESVAYQYEVSGAPFRGTQCYALGAKPLAGYATERFLESIERARKAGTFTVFVNPSKPSRAVLAPGIPWVQFVIFGSGIVIAALGLVLIHFKHPEVVSSELVSSAVVAGLTFGAGWVVKTHA